MSDIQVKSKEPGIAGRGHYLFKERETECAWVYVYRDGKRTIEFVSDRPFTLGELEEIVRIAHTLPFD